MIEKSVVLSDIDGTVYDGLMLLPFASFQVQEGSLNQKHLDQIISDLGRYKEGEWDYEFFAAKVLESWAQGLRGVSYTEVLDQSRRFLLGVGNLFHPYLDKIIQSLTDTHDFYFVTGEPQFLGQASAELYGVAGHISSEFEIESGYFTGRVRRPLARREEKREAITPILARYPWARSLALGDSVGDIEMLEAVCHPVCINPTADLSKHANLKGWSIASTESTEGVINSLISQY